MTQEALKLALEALENNKLNHLYCEDTWYSCPKHEDGCANEAEGDECNCGADEVNAQFDNAITAIKEALAQPEQEPVAWMDADGNVSDNNDHNCFPIPLYTTPPQRTWVGLTDEEIWESDSYKVAITDQETRWLYRFAKEIEAKLKEKNT